MSVVLVRNNTNRVVQIPRKYQLGKISEIDYKNYFQVGIKLELAITPLIKLANINNFYDELTNIQSSNEDLNSLKDLYKKESCLSNSVIVYGNDRKIAILSDLVYKFLSLWLNTRFVDILRDKQIRISLRDDQ